jgi:hypothetical protein
MTGPILQGQHRVSWASRTDSSTSSKDSTALRSIIRAEQPVGPSQILARQKEEDGLFLSPTDPHRHIEESPIPYSPYPDGILSDGITPGSGRNLKESEAQSAPAVLGPPHAKPTAKTLSLKHSLPLGVTGKNTTPGARMTPAVIQEDGVEDEGFHLDSEAPQRAIRAGRTGKGARKERGSPSSSVAVSPTAVTFPTVDGVPTADGEESGSELGDAKPTPDSVPHPPANLTMPEVSSSARVISEAGANATKPEGWGEAFKIEWISTKRVPFYRTRHLHNPWNQNREIKVSRDGTELEPKVGQALLDEWDRLATQQQQPTHPAPGSHRAHTTLGISTASSSGRPSKTKNP